MDIVCSFIHLFIPSFTAPVCVCKGLGPEQSLRGAVWVGPLKAVAPQEPEAGAAPCPVPALPGCCSGRTGHGEQIPPPSTGNPNAHGFGGCPVCGWLG